MPMPRTHSQTVVFDAVREMIEKAGKAPTLKELATRLGLSTITVRGHLEALQRSGWIEVTPKKWRGIRILDYPARQLSQRQLLWPQPIERVLRIGPRRLGLLCLIAKSIYLNGYSPTQHEMAECLGVCQSIIRDMLIGLEEGHVVRKRQARRMIRIGSTDQMIQKVQGQSHARTILVLGTTKDFVSYWKWKEFNGIVAGLSRGVHVIGPRPEDALPITDEREWLFWCSRMIADARIQINKTKGRISTGWKRRGSGWKFYI